MVIGERFAWAHLPKTGGDTTRGLFELFPGLIRHADPSDTNAKHDTFHDRREAIAGKTLAMNFRRLPEWVLSRAHHVSREGLWPQYRPQPMPAAQALAESSLPDERLLHFTRFGRIHIDHWLRLEHLREDFLDFVAGLVTVTPEQRRSVLELPPADVASYDRDLRRWFTAGQLHTLYEANPRWAALERELYGDLIDLS
jgi:hypothetical protein